MYDHDTLPWHDGHGYLYMMAEYLNDLVNVFDHSQFLLTLIFTKYIKKDLERFRKITVTCDDFLKNPWQVMNQVVEVFLSTRLLHSEFLLHKSPWKHQEFQELYNSLYPNEHI